MDQTPIRVETGAGAPRTFRHFDLVMAAFVAILLLSNVIGAAKLAAMPVPFWPEGWWPAPDGLFVFGAGILFFPVSYVIGDILTEVYGYERARRCIWTGFAALVFMAFMSWAVVAMPPAASWTGQSAYESVFGQVPRIVLASILAFWAGEFVNAFVLARMKVWTQGKALWSRTIGSTFVGQAVDSAIFYPVAFLGVWETRDVIIVMVTNWVLKVVWEAVLTPVTYVVVGRLKRSEGVDLYDTATDFSPFARSDRT
ncbi:queuosine precursor transporter [Altererythrobacter sp. H2]|uniref:queuosine precursor transporter n=1 Tax=Altererythrobacter sp. H2 TaxID=3108391 RepID=UPI002B4BD65B|nr:queuosine precursor transporter [Altererythrobacter sp. H2]WRK96660.1 queuosine precursor transporter [Altererythrobacter sp. H2]